MKQIAPHMKEIIESWSKIAPRPASTAAEPATAETREAEVLPPEPEAVVEREASGEPEGVPEPAPVADPPPTAPKSATVVVVPGERPSLLTDEPYDPARMGRAVHFEFDAPITGQVWPLKPIAALADTLAYAAKQDRVHLRFAGTVQGMLQLCRVAAALPDEPALVGRTSVALNGEVVPFGEVASALRQLWGAYGKGEAAFSDRVRRGLPDPLGALADAWLAELPRPGSGLSATEAALLDLAEAGATLEVARACRPGVYDEATTEALVRALAAAGAITLGPDALAITDLGRQLKVGQKDYLRCRVGVRWWGPIRVPTTSKYRYDPGSRRLIAR